LPVINYQGTTLSAEKKKKLVEKLTATAVEITQTPAKFFTVIIQEFDDENLGVEGETVAELKARLKK